MRCLYLAYMAFGEGSVSCHVWIVVRGGCIMYFVKTLLGKVYYAIFTVDSSKKSIFPQGK